MTDRLATITDLHQDGVLLPYQKRWVADPADVKVAEKSRRTGFTWGEASDDVLIAAAADGTDVLYIGYNREMAREFIDACAFWARHYALAASEVEEFVFKDESPDGDKDIHAYRVDFASGNKVLALSSRPSNLRGKQGVVVIDEAAFHDDLDALRKAAMALLMWGGKVRIVSTHNGDDNPFNQLVDDVRKGKLPYSLHRVTFDEALADGLYRRICLVLGRDWSPEAEAEWAQKIRADYGEHAAEELDCIPSKGSGIYFTTALVESCMEPGIPVLRWTCPEGFEQLTDERRRKDCQDWLEVNIAPLLDGLDKTLAHYFGEDFARDRNLTVYMPGARRKDLSLRVPFVVELANVPFKQQEQVLFFIVDRLPNFRAGAMDARGNGQYLAEVAMQRYGAGRISEVMLSQEFYREAMPKYKVRYEDRTITVPKDAEILDDHRAVRMAKGVPYISDSQRPGEKRVRRHGDAAVAGMLLVYAADQGGSAPIEYESVAVRGHAGGASADDLEYDRRRGRATGREFAGRGAW